MKKKLNEIKKKCQKVFLVDQKMKSLGENFCTILMGGGGSKWSSLGRSPQLN